MNVMSDSANYAPVKLVVERVDKATGEIKSEFLEKHGAAFPQDEGRRLSIVLYFIPVGSNTYFVNTSMVEINVPAGSKVFPIRASRSYMVADETEPRTSWSTVGWATVTKKGLMLRFDAVPASLNAVIFFHKKEEDS